MKQAMIGLIGLMVMSGGAFGSSVDPVFDCRISRNLNGVETVYAEKTLTASVNNWNDAMKIVVPGFGSPEALLVSLRLSTFTENDGILGSVLVTGQDERQFNGSADVRYDLNTSRIEMTVTSHESRLPVFFVTAKCVRK